MSLTITSKWTQVGFGGESHSTFDADLLARKAVGMAMRHGIHVVKRYHSDIFHDFTCVRDLLTRIWDTMEDGTEVTMNFVILFGNCGTHWLAGSDYNGETMRDLVMLPNGKPGALASYLDDGGFGVAIEFTLRKTTWGTVSFTYRALVEA